MYLISKGRNNDENSIRFTSRFNVKIFEKVQVAGDRLKARLSSRQIVEWISPAS